MPNKPIRDRIARDLVVIDGIIANVNNVANASVFYSYFNIGADGFKHFTVEHILTATTLTLETCNMPVSYGLELNGKGTGAGTTTTLIDSNLYTTFKYNTNKDLVGALLYIVSDTAANNVGLYRYVTDYDAATGTMTFAALPSATSTNTVYKIIDNIYQKDGRLAFDPPTTQWRDVTNVLTGSATHTASGVWFIDTPILPARFRIKRLATNATNSCQIILTRGR